MIDPLRGLSVDAAYLASVIDQISGSVLAVGHSYAGAGMAPRSLNHSHQRRNL
jgi:hypothetical protein